MKRTDWNDYFMDIAQQVATRATCDRAHVGCVIVRENRILVTGYNGSPPGIEHCDDAGHLLVDTHCVRTVHAEQNAICDAARRGVSLRNATAYLTHYPCLTCTKLLVSAGVIGVVYGNSYRVDPNASAIFEALGIQTVCCEG